MAASGLHISLSAEPIASIGGFPITNSQFTSLLISAALIIFAFFVRASLKQTNKPTGLQNFGEWVVESLYGLIYSITTNQKKTAQFLPFIGTFFLFILLNNWAGLLPGVGPIMVPVVHPEEAEHASAPDHSKEFALIPVVSAATEPALEPTHSTAEEETTAHVEVKEAGHAMAPLFRPGTADLNTTLALAIISVVMIQVFGVSYLGAAYFKKYLNFSSPIMFFVGFLETISEFVKIISFAFRLFGNIFAGEVLLVVISSLAAVIAPMPFYGLEIFVGFIQALVFSMLSIVFYDMATHSHDEH